MRPSYVLLLVALAPAAGCSAFVAASGTDLAKLKTRDEVRQKFGEPVAAGADEGVAYEEFRTRRKISDRSKGIYICMFCGMTLGLSELYLFPREVFVAGRDSLLGQTIRVEYDEAGGVNGIRHNGGYHLDCPRRRPITPAPPAEEPRLIGYEVVGQVVRVEHDDRGNVARIRLDGEYTFGPRPASPE